MSHLIEHHNEELIKRLNKIEGQVVGIKENGQLRIKIMLIF